LHKLSFIIQHRKSKHQVSNQVLKCRTAIPRPPMPLASLAARCARILASPSLSIAAIGPRIPTARQCAPRFLLRTAATAVNPATRSSIARSLKGTMQSRRSARSKRNVSAAPRFTKWRPSLRALHLLRPAASLSSWMMTPMSRLAVPSALKKRHR